MFVHWSRSSAVGISDDVVRNASCLHVLFDCLIRVSELFFRVSIPAMYASLTGPIALPWAIAHLGLEYASVADFDLVSAF